MYPMSPAFLLGLVALATLLLAVSWITGCCECCCNNRRDGVSKISFVRGIVCAIVSWLLTVHAAYMFVVALAENRPGIRGKAPCSAYAPKDNVFKPAGIVSLWATVFGLFSHKLLRFGAKVPLGPVDS